MFDLSGRVAVVTGGNRGIGLGYAQGLAKCGAPLAIWARDEKQNAVAAAELEKLGVEVLALPCDVSSEEDIVRCTEQTLERFGRIDSCFANAGFGRPGNPLKMSLDKWHSVLKVNLDGAFLTMRTVANHMIERGGGGKLIATGSMSEYFGTPMQPHYAAGKAALSSLVRSLAVSLARHDIQVNSIIPGWITTEATGPAQDHETLNNAIMGRTPARRWGTPEDLAGIAVYLASPASNYHTGDTLRVDGGYTIF